MTSIYDTVRYCSLEDAEFVALQALKFRLAPEHVARMALFPGLRRKRRVHRGEFGCGRRPDCQLARLR